MHETLHQSCCGVPCVKQGDYQSSYLNHILYPYARGPHQSQYFTLPHVFRADSEYSPSKVQGVQRQSKQSYFNNFIYYARTLLDSVRTLLGFCSKTSFLTSFFFKSMGIFTKNLMAIAKQQI